ECPETRVESQLTSCLRRENSFPLTHPCAPLRQGWPSGGQIEHVGGGAQRTVEPEGPAEAVGPGSRSGQGEAAAVDLVRFLGIHEDIAVAIARQGRGERYLLVPAVHTADGIGLDGEGEVLGYASLPPPDAG